MSRLSLTVAPALAVALLAGCGAPALPVPAVTGPPSAAVVAGCVRSASPAATVAELTSLPPGGVDDVNVDVTRPDLPRGRNRIIAVRFTADAAAQSPAGGAGAFLSGTGGRSEVVGLHVLSYVFPGDDAVVDALRGCITG